MDNAAVERARAARDMMISDGQLRAGVRAMAAALAPYVGEPEALDTARNAAQAVYGLAAIGDPTATADVVASTVASRVRGWPRGVWAGLEAGRRSLAVVEAARAWEAAVRGVVS
jgi:hypothetical protein